jgi:serine/threonine protein kinase/tetratricopeptide (TPR) repeat protein
MHTPEVGETVRQYRITQRLGAGAMGEVYLAEDTRLGRPVALKFAQDALATGAEMRDQLLREARAASALRSSNIAAIYDIVEDEGAVFIVMEYAEGEALSKRLERGALSIAEAVEIGLQIADALDEAHSRGVVHRDVKTANLIIDDRGRVKMLDFGLAKVLEPRVDLSPHLGTLSETTPGIVKGTFYYMSPEQARGRSVDHRTDLFATGVVLYEMIAGRRPFHGEAVTEVIDRILNEDPPPLARFAYAVPAELEAIVRKALEKDPGFRYQSARELYIDLHSVARLLAEAKSRSRSGAHAVPGGSAIVAAMPAGHRTADPIVAVMTFSNITREPSDDWIGSGIAETVTADLKNVHGISVMGRVQIVEALKNLSPGVLREFDEGLAIDVGRRLGARWVVGGGYQRIGELIRITAHLVDVGTGALVKTVKVDGRVSALFELQDRIVYELSQGLNLKLARSEIAGIERDETRSMEAYEAFSRGMMNLRMAGRDSLDRAIFLFEKAIAHDPSYASAWAAIGAAYDLKGSFLSLPELNEKAVEALRRAIELNPAMGMAHARLAAALMALGRYDEALAAAREAVRLEPRNDNAHATLARVLWLGKARVPDAIAELEATVALNPQAGYSYLQLALLYAQQGRFDRAEQAARDAVDLQERYLSGREGLLIVGAHSRLGYVHYLQGRYEEATREYERELVFLSSSDHALKERTLVELNQKLGAAYLRRGRTSEAERHFERAVEGYEALVARGSDDPYTRYYIACVYALRGDLEKAWQYYASTLGPLHAWNTLRARTDPDLETLRALPAFTAATSEATAS